MTMPLAYDQKEDLRMKMADLEHKLEESEEERKKLEKTCNMLVRAFREEEKMHYKALNNKYEKFLEDCKVRRRRNDVILNSLCRVEDRARALFARTERLKLLKDRYTSYIKPLEQKRNEISQNWRSLPSSIHIETTGKASTKSVSWKSPDVVEFSWSRSPRESQYFEEPLHIERNPKTNEYFSNTDLGYPERSSYKYLKQKYSQAGINGEDLVNSYSKENILDKFLLKETLKIKEKLDQPSPGYSTVDVSGYSIHKQFYPEQRLNHINDYDFNLYNKRQNLDISSTDEKVKDLSKGLDSHVKSDDVHLISHIKEKPKDCIESLESSVKSVDSNLMINHSNERPNEWLRNSDLPVKSDVQIKSDTNLAISLTNSENQRDFSGSHVKPGLTNWQKLRDLKEKGFVKHQECIKNLKTALSKEEDARKERYERKYNVEKSDNEKHVDQQIVEKDEIEKNEKNERNILMESNVDSVVKTVTEGVKGQNLMPSFRQVKMSSNSVKNNLKDFDFQNDMEEDLSDGAARNNFSFPKGLDGVDYQNETYPESYYEQPEHKRNYSDIVTNVILEEDEDEQEFDKPIEEEVSDEKAKKLSVNPTTEIVDRTYLSEQMLNSRQSSSNNSVSEAPAGRSSDVLDDSLANGQLKTAGIEFRSPKSRDPIGNVQEISHEKVRSQDSVSDKSPGSENRSKAFESEQGEINLNEKAKNVTQSNLVHLLESDSESFQIEHGGVVSGNEDSDFDFSFQ